MSRALAASVLIALASAQEQSPGPGLPPDQAKRYTGPWLQTQLSLSLAIGLSSFLLFCAARKVEKWKVLYSPRTLLKGFSPHEVHDKPSYFGWILPTLRTSEFTVLQIVGLDAAVLLSFLRMAFLFFLTCTILAFAVLVPINYRENGSTEGVPPEVDVPEGNKTLAYIAGHGSLILLDAMAKKQKGLAGGIKLPKHPAHGSTMYLTSHLVFTVLFSAIALLFLQKNYARYVPLRQLFSLDLAHSIPARTVMVTALPPHLRNERSLAEYFEGLKLGGADDSGGLGVETVTITRGVGGMKELLVKRTKALTALENAWVAFVGNPVEQEGKNAVFGYNPQFESERILNPDYTASQAASPGAVSPSQTPGPPSLAEGRLVDVPAPPTVAAVAPDADLEGLLPSAQRGGPAGIGGRPAIVFPSSGKKRPTFRLKWWAIWRPKVDALDWYAEQFRKADEEVRKRRRGKFRPTGVGFVTFETLAAAQVAAQSVHYPSATEFQHELAPEPRDIHWGNLTLSPLSVFSRKLLVLVIMFILLGIWTIPVSALANLLVWDSIEDMAPKLAAWIARYPTMRVLVQTSLPSLALVMFNNILPFFLELLSIFQGLQARSWIEYSLLKKYHLSILFTTIFVFVAASTFTLLQELSESPMKVLDRLARSLPGARNFFVAFTILNGLALMPLQLLQLNMIIPRFVMRVFFTRTPRDFAELNRPPTINLGVVYPRALLVFTIALTYSIITPLILPFATLYFGISYLVFKYQLLFVFYRPYESRGQAWPLAHIRLSWAIVIFQVFMTGLFTVRQAFLLSLLMVPVILATIYIAYRIHVVYKPLAKYVNLSQACEVQRGEGVGEITRLRRGHPVTRSQSNLNTRRYGANDETIYVVSKDEATDYAQPPLSESFPGVLNTGRRRYGHPALSGLLPEPWLPAVAPAKTQAEEVAPVVKEALVLTLRRRWSRVKRVARRNMAARAAKRAQQQQPQQSQDDEDPSQMWRTTPDDRDVISPPPDSDYIANAVFSDNEDEEEEEDGNGMTRYRTYWHRRSIALPGTFPPPQPSPEGETSSQG